MIYRLYSIPAYYCTVTVFGLVGFALSVVGFLLGWLPARPGVERFFQRVIHRCFRLFVWWGRVANVMPAKFVNFPCASRGAVVLAANHPALVDITLLLARLPEAVCIFKPTIRRNPVLGAAARRAGYLAGDGGPDLVRRAAEAVAAGNTLVVFPEGTRTPRGEKLLPFKPGFVLIARRARAPIQLVRIETDSNVLAKGLPWWDAPILPARFVLTLGPLVSTDNNLTPTELSERIAQWFKTPAPACHAVLAGLTLPAATPRER